MPEYVLYMLASKSEIKDVQCRVLSARVSSGGLARRGASAVAVFLPGGGARWCPSVSSAPGGNRVVIRMCRFSDKSIARSSFVTSNDGAMVHRSPSRRHCCEDLNLQGLL